MGMIETLRDGGFSDEEIRSRIAEERETLTNAGFSDQERVSKPCLRPIARIISLMI